MGFLVIDISGVNDQRIFNENKLMAFGTMFFKTVGFIEYFFQYFIQDQFRNNSK